MGEMNAVSTDSRHTGTAGRLERKSLSDAELIGTELQIGDPRALPNLSANPPDPNGLFNLAGEYHLPNNDPGLRCSYCPTHTIHRNGFALAGEGHHFVLGSTCGPKHFGLSFAASKRELSEQKDRQSYLLRLRAIAARSEELIAAYNAVLFSGSLKVLEDAKTELESASPALTLELRASANAGLALQEIVKVRDLQAEAKRTDDRTTPIYRSERHSLGSIEGTALVSSLDPRATIYKLKRALTALASFLKGGTDGQKTSRLRAEYRVIEELHSAAQRAVTECNNAHHFFGSRNRTRLAQWSERKTADRFAEVGDQLAVVNKNGRRVLPSLAPLHLPTLPDLLS